MREPPFEPCAKWAEVLAVPRGELEPHTYILLRKHLQSCSACSRADTNYEKVKALLGNLPGTEEAPTFATRLPEHLEKLWEQGTPNRQAKASSPSYGPPAKGTAYQRTKEQAQRTKYKYGESS